MKSVLKVFPGLAVFGVLFLSVTFSGIAYADKAETPLVSRTAEIDGVKLHYMTAGQGPAVILLRTIPASSAEGGNTTPNVRS